MAEHTPGPWRADTYQGRARVVAVGGVADGLEVARCLLQGPSQGECQANARLIAAVPDLLAACEAASVFLHAPDSATRPIRSTQKMVDAAIAKAHGEEAS